VAKDRAKNQAWSDPDPGRFRKYALAPRPLFKEALESSKLEDFLPRARDVFLALQEVESARAAHGGPPKLAIAGPAQEVVRERLKGSKYDLWIHSFNHGSDGYAQVLPQLGAGDLLVLLVTRDKESRIPSDRGDVSPMALDEIDRRLTAGETIAKEGSVNLVRVVLLVAPTGKQLAELARKTPLLHD